MATAEWETYALSGRFKNERRRKRLLKEERDKKLVRTFKELRKLKKAQCALGYADLVPPVQKGWKRFFVLRPDAAAGKDAGFFLGLLEKVNTTTYSHRKDFKYKCRRNGKRVDVERVQKVKMFWTWEFKKLHLAEKEKPYFKLDWFVNDRGHLIPIYVFTEPWRFVLKVKPNMITKVKVIDPGMMSLESEIDGYLDRNMLVPRVVRLLRGSYSGRCRWKNYPKAKYRELLKSNPLDEIDY